MNLNNFYKVLGQLWHAETLPTDVVVHLCFLVVSSFAFFFFNQLAVMMTSDYIIITDIAIDRIGAGIKMSNVLLNLLFMLIIIEGTQIAISRYTKYTRENL